jgi:Family of unknown function (DUF5686)/CarboxypepD_reg-like domain
MRYFIFLYCLVHFSLAQSVVVKGRIEDGNHSPIAFANAFIKNASIGVIANSQGEYTLKLKPGSYTLVFKQIGYKAQVFTCNFLNDTTINATLQDETVELKEVVVNTEENPAIRIIKNAQKQRAFYRNQVNAFSCDVYIKGMQKIKEKPKKIMGIKVDIPTLIDTVSGIVYLSESVSKFYFQQKNKIREDMVASKVSGNNNAFSFNRASDMYFNFYENLIQVDQLVPRGLISPIANTSLLTYKFKYKGTIIDQKQLVHKIEMSPRVKSDPAFRGTIYIQDSTWRIQAIDVFLTKEAGIAFVDTLKIQQTYTAFDETTWMPFTNVFSFSFGVFGIKGGGQYTSTNSNYVLKETFNDTTFSALQFKVSRASLNKDTAFWAQYRPTPLSTEERKDYVLKDSVMRIRRSKPYLDSTDKKNNQFKFINVLTGYTHTNSFKKERWGIGTPLNAISYNTVQGWNVDLDFNYFKRDSLRRYNTLNGKLQYGFSNKTFGANIDFFRFFDTKHLSSFQIKAGRTFEQYNSNKPIGNLNNLLHTLWFKQNYMKLYQKDELTFAYTTELTNGFYLKAKAGGENRTFLDNQSFETFTKQYKKRNFSDNQPNELDTNSTALYKDNAIVKAKLGFTWKVGQKFELREERKIVLEQKWPELNFDIEQGLSVSGQMPSQYTKGRFTLIDKIDFKLLGNMEVLLQYEHFFQQKNLRAPDYIHINGNQTAFTDFALDQFQLAPYYVYSTKQYNVSGAIQHNFGGFIFNKIPLLNRLHLEEHATVKVFHSDKQKLYTEYSFGLSKLMIRADGVFGYDFQKKEKAVGLRVALIF